MPKDTSFNENPAYMNNQIIAFTSRKPSDCGSHLPIQTLPSSTSTPPSMFCPRCKKPCGRRQELCRHILSFHLPCSISCPYSPCPWRGDREEELQKHLKRQKCGPLKPKREQWEIYERSVILDWILNRGEPVEQVARYALGVVEERAREMGKVEEWGDLWGHQWKATRRRRNEQHGSFATAVGTSFAPSCPSAQSNMCNMSLLRTDAEFVS